MSTRTYQAVVFDLGGVVFPGPFAAFDAYNTRAGLPEGFVRGLIRTSSETGAWAALERGELSTEAFHQALEAEAEELGARVDAAAIMAEVGKGFGPRPEMLRAIEAIRAAGLRTAALTNNWASDSHDTTGGLRDGGLFDVVVESAVVGLRKPDPRIYELVLRELTVAPADAIFLDDLGINLKPARAMGMTTIKVVDHHDAIAELAGHLGIALG
jgi:putative hydrolase of the HAD superfamily